MNDPFEDDETLLARLGAILDLIDPIAPTMTAAGSAAYSWRRIDAELAELLSDSATSTEPLAAARGLDTVARTLTFEASTLTIKIELHPRHPHGTILGQLSPAAAAEIKLQTPLNQNAGTTMADEQGRFRFDMPTAEAIRLRIRAQEGTDRGWVDTSWIAL
jgi:hypothetical protein